MNKYKLTHKNNINNNKTNKNIKYLQNGGYKKTYKINNFKFIVTTKNMMDNENITELNNEISNKNNDINDIKSKDYIKITIGSGSIKCVELTINKDDPKNASLDRFDYQLDCNISKDMKRKIDIHKMMDTLILFLKNELKTDMNINIDTITLEDGSKRPCEGTKFNIMYYDLYLFKYGSTYYNYTYGFDFYYESDKEQHNENLRLINGVSINKEEFINYLMIKHIYKDKIANHKENIAEFLENIIDGILATEFIKTYLPKDHLSYLLHYFFMFMKQISGYQPLLYVSCIKQIS
jgi:hypothetical protein